MKKRVFAIASILTVAVVLTASLSACGAVTESFSPVAVSGEYREQVMGSAAAYDYLEWLGSEDMRSRYGSVDSDELNINYGIGKAAVSLAAEMEKKGYQPVEGVSITVNQEGYLSTHGGSEITGIMSYPTSTICSAPRLPARRSSPRRVLTKTARRWQPCFIPRSCLAAWKRNTT